MTNSANDAGLCRLGTVVSLAGGLGALDAFPKPILYAGGQDNEGAADWPSSTARRPIAGFPVSDCDDVEVSLLEALHLEPIFLS